MFRTLLTLFVCCYFLFPQIIYAKGKKVGGGANSSSSWRKTLPIKRHKVGFIFSHSLNKNVNYYMLWSGPYYFNVRLFKLQYAYTFFRITKTTHLDMLLQPQINTAKYSPDGNTDVIKNSIEFGVNIGLVIKQSLFKNRWHLYGEIATGPHYVTATPFYQTKGFIFSDNLALGTDVKIYKNWFFDFRVGWRHMSNANIKEPNSGINNLLLNWGFFYNF